MPEPKILLLVFLNLPTINCWYPEEHDGADYVQRVEYCQPKHQVVE